MKFKKPVSVLVIIIIVLSLFASLYGIFSNQGQGSFNFQSIRGENVTIYGKGIYKYDSISAVSQGIAQDAVTLVLGIPLLIISLYLSQKGLLRGRLLLTGTLGYFLYTYISYSFLWMYNSLFLVYVVLMSASFFAFILSIMSFDVQNLKESFSDKLPVKTLGGFQIFFAVAIGLMWLGRIVPSIINGTVPAGLEHYNTLVIQAMDLGFIVPAATLSGILLIRRKPFGYLLTSVIVMKSVTMATAISAMVIGQAKAGVPISFAEMTIFPLINLGFIYLMVLILKNIKEGIHNK